MLRGIDHIVVVVPELAEAIEKYGALGFTVVPGGTHPTGTHNALVGFQDGSYIELIAFYRPEPGHRWYGMLNKGRGLVDFCAQTDDLRGDTVAFREAGVTLGDPSPLSRTRPDGYRLEWQLAIPEGAFQGIVPFLIEDFTPRAERPPKQTTHANQVTGISALTIVTDDIAMVAQWYRNIGKSPLSHVAYPEYDADGMRIVIGPHALDFIQPRTSSGPLPEWLRTRDPGVYAVTLKTAGEAGTLDETLTLNARIVLTRG
jgi:catechol 2,3-dioxygenase-like lactoylglutathione lyase family enzyme